MIKSKKLNIIAAIFMAIVVVLTLLILINPNIISNISQKANFPYVSEMDKTKIMTFDIKVDKEEWDNMIANATQEEYIMADVTINGTTIKSVGIRPKGNSSLSMVASDSTTDRFSFKIEFDHYINGQTWLGLDKIVINNMIGDATYLKEYISYDVMDYIGVVTPKFAFTDVSINGETWGLYLAVEGIEESYLMRNYAGEGEMYKPDSMGIRGAGNMEEFINEMNNQLESTDEFNEIENFITNNIGDTNVPKDTNDPNNTSQNQS